ncbi:restriction endonuclease subunit S [Clostridium hydrogenum]|uniref:restriction endonuclease subunit S n=1 Tax=Clostridium hydrogenum TaxID=2855764 RepID=UPI001F3B1A84|nr:restriction endonuclease subunit S [Clostridium hydrogenum]
MGKSIKTVPITEIFEVINGKDLVFSRQEKDVNGINFVSRTNKNNGINNEKIKRIEGNAPHPPNTISVALSGSSILEAFLQKNEYYTSFHMRVLKPKILMSDETMLFYCMCIKKNKFKYGFGRQANSTLEDMKIPSLDMIPDYVKKSKIPKPETVIADIPDYFISEEFEQTCWYLDNINAKEFESNYGGIYEFQKEKLNINLDNWKEYRIDDLFEIYTGDDLTMSALEQGEYNVVSHSKSNNGVCITTKEIKRRNLFSCERTLSLADRGNFFATIQPSDFYIATRVKALKALFDDCDKFVLEFIAVIINMEAFRFGYGRNCCDKLNFMKIKLPTIKEKGDFKKRIIQIDKKEKEVFVLDTKFMRKYVKALPFTKHLIEEDNR